MGIGLISFSIYYLIGLIDAFNDPKVHKIYVEAIVAPVLPLLIGFFCVYSSIRTGIIMKIENDGKRISLPLTKIIKKDELKEFIGYINDNKIENSKLKIYVHSSKQ